MNKTDEDRFFEVLEGKTSADAETSGARVLRQAVQVRAETLREIADISAKQAEQSNGMTIRRQILFKKLQSVNAFSDLPGKSAHKLASTSPRPMSGNTRSILENLIDFFSGAWIRPVSFAAMLVLAVGIIVQQAGLNQQENEHTVVRGTEGNIVLKDKAAQFVVDLTRRLNANGAAVIAQQIDSAEWNLTIEISAASDRSVVQRLLRDAGFRDIEVGSNATLIVREAASVPSTK